MVRLPFVLFLVVLALFVVLAVPSQAATTGVGIGIQGGFGQSKDAENGSPIAGAHVILNVAPWIGVVGMIDYKFPEDYKEKDASYEVKSFPISAMGRIYIPIESFSPYVAAGVQYRLINYGGDLFKNTDLDDSETAFGWLVGAGAEFDISPTSELFGEFRYEAADPDRDVENAVSDAKDFKYDQWTARAGFTFFLK